MNFTPASSGSVAVFLVIVVGVLVAMILAVRHAYRDEPKRTAGFVIGLGVWLGLLVALVGSGRLALLPLQGLPLFFGGILIVSLAVGLSPLGGRVAATIPLAGLVGFQAFRLPLEMVLHSWSEQGTIPATMTWTGQNWDIVTGSVCLAATPFANRFRGAAWTANLIGLLLLLNVIRVAVLSSPLPFAWDVQPKLLLAFHLPYALIAPVCVGGALAGHVVLTRGAAEKNFVRTDLRCQAAAERDLPPSLKLRRAQRRSRGLRSLGEEGRARFVRVEPATAPGGRRPPFAARRCEANTTSIARMP